MCQLVWVELGRVLILRQIQGRVINTWLVVIAVLGTVIALADGLTRTPVLEREAYWNGPLEYQPYLGAVLLAGMTLALMFGYVRRAGISVTEGLFLWFVFCTTAYTRDFSYIHWPGTPLFVTEIVLVLLFLSIYLLARSRDVHVPLPVNVFLAILVAAGALSALRGFLQHSEPILVLRDAALVAYPLFLHVAHSLFRSWLSIKRMAVWFLLGTSLSVLNGFAWFLAAPQERRFIYYGTYILMALVGTFVAIANRLLPPRTGWILAGLFCLGLALANARTLFVALPVLLVVGLYAGGIAGRKPSRPRIALATFVAAAVLISAMAFLFLRTETGRDFAERSSQELATGVLHSDEDTNWQFRLSAWKEAWRRFEEYPLAGEGYGIPFAFELLLFDNDPRPHNTFLTVLYKMGLIGFLPLLALVAYFFWSAIGAACRNLENPRVAWLWIVVLAVVAFCFYGSANLLLESPFLASLFWVLMGLGLRMARMVDLERTLLRPSHEH
jgi:O-antigen ligase